MGEEKPIERLFHLACKHRDVARQTVNLPDECFQDPMHRVLREKLQFQLDHLPPDQFKLDTRTFKTFLNAMMERSVNRITPSLASGFTTAFGRIEMQKVDLAEAPILLDAVWQDTSKQIVASAFRTFNKDRCIPDLQKRLSQVQADSEPLKIWGMGELLDAKDVEQHPPLIDGLLRRGEILNLVAAPKARKSWFILELATCLEHGEKWLDRFQCSKASVLLIDNELRLPTLKHRAEMICSAKGIKSTDGVKILSVRGKKFTLDNIAAFITKTGAEVVILDALYRFMPEGFDENSNGDMTKIYNRLDAIATETGAAIIVIHHASKGSQSQKSITDVGSGAGAQSRAADAHLILRVTKKDADQAKEDTATLDAVARSFPPIDKMLLKWDYPLWEPADSSVSFAEVKADMPVDVFVEKFFTDSWEASMAIFVKAEADGVSKRQYEKYRHDAMDKGLIELKKIGTSKQYRKMEAKDGDQPF